MSEMAFPDDGRDEVDLETAAEFLEASEAYVLEMVKVGELSSRAVGDVRLIPVSELEAFAAEQARRRPLTAEIYRIGAEQLENEYRRGLI